MKDQQAVNLHKCLLIIAEEIKRICEKNDIKYFLIGGSLLGCVRHEGFIPWDDDMDIGILRNDYNRFYKCLKVELNKSFVVGSFDTEKNYGLPFIKVKLRDTHFTEQDNPDDVFSGIFVDVFPIDTFPDQSLKQFYQKHMMRLLKRAILYNCNYKIEDNKHSGLSKSIAYLLSKLDKRTLTNKLIKVQTKYNNEQSQNYSNNGSSYVYGKELFPRECLDSDTQLMKFENTSFPIPHNPELILKSLYGDFMKLPPEDKRVFRHTSDDIDFGKYCE